VGLGRMDGQGAASRFLPRFFSCSLLVPVSFVIRVANGSQPSACFSIQLALLFVTVRVLLQVGPPFILIK
jgi:hypothetical protein